MRRLFYIVFFCTSAVTAWSQEDPGNILTAQTKDPLTGEVLTLLDRLDPEVNYIIDASQFWCAPCNRGIGRLRSIKNYLKETYNVEVVLLEDEHWNDLDLALEKKEAREWDFELFILNENFDFFGIDSYPTYFFVPAGFTEPKQEGINTSCTVLDDFLKTELRTINFSPSILTNIKQTTTKDCVSAEYLEVDETDTQYILGIKYILVNGQYLREDSISGNIYRYEAFPTLDSLYLDFSLSICSTIELKDIEGDKMPLQIVDTYKKDGREHLVTNKMIINDCGEETPFEFITGLGTNAGLLFDIEDAQIVSRLVCHTANDQMTYRDADINLDCITSATSEKNKNEIKLYPNPTARRLTLELFWLGTTAIQIHNVQGQEVYSDKSIRPVVSIDLRDLQSGLYYLSLKNDERIETRKIFKY